jgi:hypothetical protein
LLLKVQHFFAHITKWKYVPAVRDNMDEDARGGMCVYSVPQARDSFEKG